MVENEQEPERRQAREIDATEGGECVPGGSAVAVMPCGSGTCLSNSVVSEVSPVKAPGAMDVRRLWSRRLWAHVSKEYME